MRPDKITITITGDGYSVEAKAERTTIAEHTAEIVDGGVAFEKTGDLFVDLPVEIAATIDAMELALMDAVIYMMPEAA